MMGRLAWVPAVALMGLAACGGGAVSPGQAPDAQIPIDAAPPDMAPDAAPAPRVWFVEAGATGGDGGREAPFGDPAAAYAVARPEDVVLLLPGAHPTPPLPPPGVELSGSGPEVTSVAGPLVIDGPALIKGLAVEGGAPPLTVAPAGQAELEDVAVAAAGVGVAVDGALIARGLVAAGAPALRVAEGAEVDARGGGFEGVDGPAIASAGQLTLEASRVASSAEGIRVEGGTARVEGIRIDRASVGALVVGGRLELTGGLIREARTPGATGAAIRVTGGEARVESVEVEASDRGLRVDAEGTLRASGVTVRAPITDGLAIQGGAATVDGLAVRAPGNAAVAVLDGGRLTLEGARLDDARRVGVLVDSARLIGSGITVQGSTARGLILSDAEAEIEGLLVIEAADVGAQITDPRGEVRLTDARFARCGTSGVSVFGDSGPVRLTGVTVEGTTPGDMGLADGIHLFQARGELIDVVSRDNAGAGVLVEQSMSTLTRGALSGNADPGLVALEPRAPVQAAELTIEGNGGAGALAIAGALALTDCVIRETGINPGVGPGHGAFATAGGRLEVLRGASVDNVGSGVAFDPGTAGEVGGVTLTGNGGYGLRVSCGAAVEEPAANTARDNRLGPRSVCDR